MTDKRSLWCIPKKRRLFVATGLMIVVCVGFLWDLFDSQPAGGISPRTTTAPTSSRQLAADAEPPAITEPLVPLDPFKAAAARKSADIPRAPSGATDCVALLNAYRTAVTACRKVGDQQACVLAALGKQGFDPRSLDFCMLFQPGTTASPFG
jgi:hypothetical protein